MKKFICILTIIFSPLFFFYNNVSAEEEYACEVMAIQGEATAQTGEAPSRALKQGDLLKAGDLLEVKDQSRVDLAFDKGWNNLTRVGEKSKIKIRSLYPTGLAMDYGDVLAKLGKLPPKSTFEIETPTAIAAVRGSEYRTTFRDGATEVFNLHDSQVEVFTKNLEGMMEKTATVLGENEKTHVRELGEQPAPPQKMTDEEIRVNREATSDLSNEASSAVGEGRLGKVQDIDTVSKEYGANLEKRLEDGRTGSAPGTDSGDQNVSKAVGTAESAVEKTENKIQQDTTRQAETTVEPPKKEEPSTTVIHGSGT